MTSGLKPCPFCGGEADTFKQEEKDYFSLASEKAFWLFGAGCWDCGCQVYGYDTEQEAIEAWNKRAERTCEDVSKPGVFFECSECGAIDVTGGTGNYTLEYCPACGARIVGD